MEAADSNTISLKIFKPPISKIYFRRHREQEEKPITTVIKLAIFLVTVNLRMHIVMIVARRDILL